MRDANPGLARLYNMLSTPYTTSTQEFELLVSNTVIHHRYISPSSVDRIDNLPNSNIEVREQPLGAI
jgi:hypothetical protein